MEWKRFVQRQINVMFDVMPLKLLPVEHPEFWRFFLAAVFRFCSKRGRIRVATVVTDSTILVPSTDRNLVTRVIYFFKEVLTENSKYGRV